MVDKFYKMCYHTNMQNTLSIISTKSQTCSLLKSFLTEYNESFSVKIYENFENSINNSIVILDLTSNFDVNLINELILRNCKVIVLAQEVNIDLIVKTIRLGAKEFLPMPIIKSEFFDVLNRVLSEDAPKQNSKCKIISVFSNKGGIGKTSIATNLAVELEKITKEKVALVDLNLRLGDVATFLDVKPSFNISYMIQNLDKIDESFLLSTLENYNNTNLFVLADSVFLEQQEGIRAEKIGKLFEILKRTFSYIIIDCQTNFDAINMSALTNSDLILLVTVANLPVLRNTQMCLDLFDKLGFEKVQILLNRFMENDDINEKDVVKLIGKKIFWKIPNNYFTLMSAINKGVPVSEINSDSNISKNYKELALNLTDKIYKTNLEKKYKKVIGGPIGNKR